MCIKLCLFTVNILPLSVSTRGGNRTSPLPEYERLKSFLHELESVFKK